MRHYLSQLLLAIALLSSRPGLAQMKVLFSTKPLPTSAQHLYVVIPTGGVIATHVKTQRQRLKGTEYLELLNVILPASFVQQLIASGDIGLAGLLPHDELLVTLAVLPDLSSGRVEWTPIQLDTVASTRRLAWSTVAGDCYTRLFNYKAAREAEVDWSRRRLDLRPVLKQGKQYITPKQVVLTEYFVLRNHPTWYPTTSDNATINCLARPYPPLAYLKDQEAATAEGPPDLLLRKELGTKLLLQQVANGIYTFWSFPPSSETGVASVLTACGIGDLRFQPGIGIISGRYSSYFGPITQQENTFFGLTSIEKIM